MRVDEIEYASGIRSVAQHLSVEKATHLGMVDNHNIYEQDLGNSTAYFLVDNDNILAYVALDDQHRLKQLENITKIAGAVTTILYFLTRKKGYKIVIDKTEPLTLDGLNWLVKLIISDRNLFKITDQSGNSPSIDDIKKEWEDVRTGKKQNGEIGIVIENTGIDVTRIFEDAPIGLLKPAYKILHDSSLI